MSELYFKLDKNKSKKIWDDFLEMKNPFQEAFNLSFEKFKKDYNADNIITRKWRDGKNMITGFTPAEEKDNYDSYLKKDDYEDGDKWSTFLSPNMKYKKGKELKKRLTELEELINKIPNLTDSVCPILGLEPGEWLLNYKTEGGRGSRIIHEIIRMGYMNNVIVLAIPEVYNENKHIDLTYGLIPIKKSEFIAITEE